MTTTKDIRMNAGQTIQVRLTARDAKGAPTTLTGATVYLSVTADLKVAPLFTLQSPGDIVIADQSGAEKGKCTATIAAARTADLIAMGDSDPYFWDAWVVDIAGAQYPIISTSRLSLFPPVTRL